MASPKDRGQKKAVIFVQLGSLACPCVLLHLDVSVESRCLPAEIVGIIMELMEIAASQP